VQEKQISDRAASPDKPLSTTTTTLLSKVNGDPQGMDDRGITPNTVRQFGVVVQGDRHIYPYYSATDTSELIAAKKRLPQKVFPSEGPMKDTALFGSHCFSKGGRNIVITEGETDAMAVYQLQGSKYPSVSVRSSATALSDCRRNYDWLDSFDEVIICFDNDDAGKKAAKKVAELFSGKAKVMKFGAEYNDPVDVLLDGAKGREAWKHAFWNAETYTPDGIMVGKDMWELVSKPMEKSPAQYPMEGLNTITYGIRLAELVCIAAGSGLGKSQFCREIIWQLLNSTDWNIGCLFMEESPRKTGLSLMSLACDKPLHLPITESTEEERRSAFGATLGSDRLFFFDHFGSTAIDNVVARCRYMVKAHGCKALFLDHVSIIVSSGENGDERRALDEAMTKLRTMCQELDVALFVVSHLKRPDGKGHEEGGTTSLAQLRGSASIAQLSDIVLGLERDGQSDDPEERNTTRVRVLKNRFSGETGLAAAMLYDLKTGRMHEKDDIEATPVAQLEEGL